MEDDCFTVFVLISCESCSCMAETNTILSGFYPQVCNLAVYLEASLLYSSRREKVNMQKWKTLSQSGFSFFFRKSCSLMGFYLWIFFSLDVNNIPLWCRKISVHFAFNNHSLAVPMEESDNKERSWHQGFIGQTSVSATSLFILCPPLSLYLSLYLPLSVSLLHVFRCW